MMPAADSQLDVNVQAAEYIRLLGYPPGFVLRDRARELADWARAWYGQFGRPWVFVRPAVDAAERGGTVTIDGVPFVSPRLARTCRDAGAHAARLVAVSAGPELEAEAQRLWRDEKPDEYFFLEIFGSAVVEHLVTMVGARLCAWADGEGLAVLPHYSPGYPEWPIDDQSRVHELIGRGHPGAPLPLDVLPSGMLRPKKSLLAVFGLTRHIDRVAPLSDLVPCENCSFLACQFRRVPYRRSPESADQAPTVAASDPSNDESGRPPAAAYTTSRKALQRWAEERLTLTHQPDGSVDAEFRYDGTTCTNMGRPLQFVYRVTLGPRGEGYPIRAQACAPAEGDDGHRHMCRYLTDRDGLMRAVWYERPLNGRPLGDVLTWTRATRPAGCYCDAESREHKWGLVLETIHFALASGGGSRRVE
jgi:hypothetical protein